MDAPEAANAAGVDHLAVARQPHSAVAGDKTVGDVAAGDVAELAGLECGADLGRAMDGLDLLGLEQTFQSQLHLVDEAVDDVVSFVLKS